MLRQTFILSFTFILLIALVPSVLALPAFQEEPPCVGDPECYEPPPEETAVPEPNSPPSEPSWEGYNDGRLNPNMAEYYSVWCTSNLVRVMRGVPSPDVITDIRLADVIALSDGSALVDGNVTVTRSGDIITIFGSNGNLAPQPGSKSFSLSECIERNGGEPSAETTSETESQQNEGNDQSDFVPSRCEDNFYAATHVWSCQRVISCTDINDVLERPTDCGFEGSSVEKLFGNALRCINFPVFTAVGSFAAFRIRRKRR